MSPISVNKDRLEGLDALRGFAACAVVFAHFTFIVRLPQPQGVEMAAAIATLAVQLFFVLSAFSLCVGYFGRLNTRADMTAYAIRRVLRIAPLFYFMSAVWIGLMIHRGGPFPTLEELLVNLTFLFGFFQDYHNSVVSAGWSLGVEMIFYALLPGIFVLVRGWKSGISVTVGAILLCFTVSYSISPEGNGNSFRLLNTAAQLPCFLGGILAYLCFRKLRALPGTQKVLAAYAFSAIAALYWWALFYFGPQPDLESLLWRTLFVSGFPFVVLAFALHGPRLLVNRATVWLGIVSYSIYLGHTPVLVIVEQGLREWLATDNVSVLNFALGFAVTLGLVIPVSSFTYLLVEKPFQQLAARIKRPARPAQEPRDAGKIVEPAL